MIVDIKKGKFIKGLIEYHERKVDKGRGERILDGTLSDNISQRVKYYMGHAELNRNVYRNKFAHISISFNPNDRKLDRDAFLSLANRYLAEMGYDQTPLLIYEHFDTKQQHFHIVTTTTDFSGKKIKELNNFERSANVSRELEKEFRLIETTYSKSPQKDLAEINAERYSIYNALKKAAVDPDHNQKLLAFLNLDNLEALTVEPITNFRLNTLIQLREKKAGSSAELYRYLEKNGLIVKSKKSQLLEKLQYVKSLSLTREDFMENITKQGLYVRQLFDNKQGTTLTYGMPEIGFYVTDKSLPSELRWDYLFTDKKVNAQFDERKQIQFLRKNILPILKRSGSKEQFEKLLYERNIETIYARNSAGIYGISFRSVLIQDPLSIKGSSIHESLSWNKIQEKFGNEPDLKVSTNKQGEATPGAGTYIPRSFGNSLDTSKDDGDKRRKDENKDLEKD